MFSPDQWAASTGVAFYNGVATQSLRFDDGSSAYLSRTPSSAGNTKTHTLSMWVKLSALTTDRGLIGARNGSTFREILYFTNSDKLQFYTNVNGTVRAITTDAIYRDVSSWYHIVIAVDTTQSTDSNRAKIYINGEEQSVQGSYPDQNAGLQINNSVANYLGAFDTGGAVFDGYMAEVNLVDGSALDPTSFGETKNGVWIPIEYTGSYGTNGFRLQFNQTGTGTASSSTIGADTSGNTNHFSSSGIVASDCDMPDSPENNFATLNPLLVGGEFGGGASDGSSEGNLKGSNNGSGGWASMGATFLMANGKWYWEFASGTASGESAIIGIHRATGTLPVGILGYTGDSDGYAYGESGNKFNNNTGTSYGATWDNNDVIGVAYDADGGSLTFYKNNVSQGVAFSSLSGEFIPAISTTSGTGNSVINFGQDSSFAGNKTAQGNTDANGIGDFYYSPPSGYLALCSDNLPEPTISPNADTQADDYFNTVLYTGNGTGQSITGVGLQPDWVWIKSRSHASGHVLTDSVRGVTKSLFSDTSGAELTLSGGVTAFGTDGFTLGSEGTVNTSARTYVAWNWKAGGTAVSNTDGSITSSVSGNTDAGFSIVNYTGTGSSATVGHGLGKKPSLIFIKRRAESSNWAVAGSVLGSTATLYLNLTNAQETYSDPTIINTQTTTTFSIGTDTNRNKNTFEHIAYCFAEIEGFSKFGSYTGNGNSDNAFVFTGFTPAFCIVKRTDLANQWNMWDNQRSSSSGSNVIDRFLMADNSNAENTSGGNNIDLLSNGFKIRNNGNASGGNGGTYIYMAFAEAPFKYANAR